MLSEPVLLLPLELLPLPELLLPSELLFPEVLPERSPEPLLLLPEVPLLPEVLFSSPPVVSLLSVSSGSFSSSLGLLVFLEELLPLPFDGPETTSIFVIGFSYGLMNSFTISSTCERYGKKNEYIVPVPA